MSQPEFKIRQATVKDASAIASFNQDMAMETEGITLDPPTILSGVTKILLDDNFGFYLVIEVAQEIVASLMVTTEWSDWRNGQYWWIQSVYVKPQWRRKGLYRAMYLKVKTLSEANSEVCGFRLYVENENIRAQSTYESLGMTQTHYKMYEEIKAEFKIQD